MNDGKKASSPGDVSLRSGKKLINAYVRFVEPMNYWATIIGASPAKLEEFAFGYDLRSGSRHGNPRMELWKIVKVNRGLVACK